MSPYLTTISPLPGPVPIQPTLTPVNSSTNSTYFLAFCGSSSQVFIPVVLVCHPGNSVYSTSTFSRTEISAGNEARGSDVPEGDSVGGKR